MSKYRWIFLLCNFSILICSLFYNAYSESLQTELKEGRNYLVICRDGGSGGYEAFPDICRLPDGRLFCVIYAGYDHVSLPSEKWKNGGKIIGIYSDNEGRTWSEPVLVYDGPYDDRDPSVTVIDNKKVICNFFSLKPAEGKSYEGLGTYMVVSEDLGQTWSKPRIITTNYYCSSPIRILPNGNLILALYAGNEKKNCGAVVISHNKGESWSGPIDVPLGELQLDAEPDICILSNEKLYMAQRGKDSKSMGYSISTDWGKTWTISQPLKFPGHCPYLHRTVNNVIVMGIRYPGKGTYIVVSTDECNTWSDPILVDPCIGAYPSMVNLKDGTVLIVYYEEGSGSNIRARKFSTNSDGKVNWLTWED